MTAVNGERSTLAERVEEGSHNVLVLAPHLDGPADAGCVDLLTVDPPASENAIVVTLVQSADDRLAAWEAHAGEERPARIGFVAAGGAGGSAVEAARTDGGDVSVQTVSSPGNLTDLGIKVSAYLTDWEDDDNRTVLCFHSLSILLQYADLQRAFRFLHVLTGRVRAIDGFAHYHMDPGTHDEQSLATLLTLFDGVAEWDGEHWSVRNR